MIKPSIGRIVWYYPSAHDLQELPGMAYFDTRQPLAAQIVYVWNDEMVNLAVHDQNGQPFHRRSVTLVQDGKAAPAGASRCEWMPYQAAKAQTEATSTDAIAKSPRVARVVTGAGK